MSNDYLTIEMLMKKIELLESDNSNLKNLNDDLLYKLSLKENSSDSSDALILQLEQINRDLKVYLDYYKSEYENFLKQISVLEIKLKNYTQMEEKVYKTNSDIFELQRSNKNLKHSISEYKILYENLENKYNEKCAKVGELQDLVNVKNNSINQLRESNNALCEDLNDSITNFNLTLEDIERANTYNVELQKRLKDSNDYLNNHFPNKIRKLERENSRLKDELNIQTEYKKYLVNHSLEVIHKLALNEMLSKNINYNSTVLDVIEELILGYKELFNSNKHLKEYVNSIKESINNKQDNFQYKYEKTKPFGLDVHLEKTLGGKIDYNKPDYIVVNGISFLKI